MGFSRLGPSRHLCARFVFGMRCTNASLTTRPLPQPSRGRSVRRRPEHGGSFNRRARLACDLLNKLSRAVGAVLRTHANLITGSERRTPQKGRRLTPL
jgi:hypothetical protein